jgi:hypothetical protein
MIGMNEKWIRIYRIKGLAGLMGFWRRCSMGLIMRMKEM